MPDVQERLEHLCLLDAEEPKLWHTGGQDRQCGFSHSRLVQAKLREAGRSGLEIEHHPSISHFGLIQGQEIQAL